MAMVSMDTEDEGKCGTRPAVGFSTGVVGGRKPSGDSAFRGQRGHRDDGSGGSTRS